MTQRYGRIAEDIERMRRLVLLGLFAVLVMFVFFEALRGAQFWNKVKGEGNLWNYGSSLQYFMAGQMAFLNAILFRYYGGLSRSPGVVKQPMIWALAGAAFVFFACDEMLEVHEKLGLAIERSIPAIHHYYPGHADNLITGLYAVGGLFFAVSFLRGMAPGRAVRWYFVSAMGIMILSTAMDVIPKDLYVRYLPVRETEELMELLAGFLFMAAFMSVASLTTIRVLQTHETGVSSPATGVEGAASGSQA
jgi:hypothetical protein